MNVYHTWAKHKGEMLKIQKAEPEKLFFIEQKKQNA